MHYRNKQSLIANGVEVEPHSLWKLNGNTLLLVDDDQYAEHPLTDAFYKTDDV